MLGAIVPLINPAIPSGTPQTWPGGQGVFTVTGTFGGATVKLQFLGPDGSTYFDAGQYTTVTAAGGGCFILPPGQIQAVTVGGSPSGIFATAARVPF